MISYRIVAIRRPDTGTCQYALLCKVPRASRFYLVYPGSCQSLRIGGVVLTNNLLKEGNVVDDINTVSFATACIEATSGSLLFGSDYEGWDFTLDSRDAVELTDGSIVDVAAIINDAFQTPASDNAGSSASVDRENVAIKIGYGQDILYQGFRSYHGYVGTRFNRILQPDGNPYRIGVELELYATSRAAYDTIIGARSNWFQCERDGSLTQGEFPIEMKTIPLRASDAMSVEFWDKPMARLQGLAISKTKSSTGLHVHIGKEILGDNDDEMQKTISKLNYFYVYHIEDVPYAHEKNIHICGRERGYSGSLESAKSAKASELKRFGCLNFLNAEGQREIGEELNSRCRSQRWDINLGRLDSYGTIEFRKGKGAISKTRMAGLVSWWVEMCLYCRETAWESLNFEDFFRRACDRHPAVAYWFVQDQEC